MKNGFFKFIKLLLAVYSFVLLGLFTSLSDYTKTQVTFDDHFTVNEWFSTEKNFQKLRSNETLTSIQILDLITDKNSIFLYQIQAKIETRFFKLNSLSLLKIASSNLIRAPSNYPFL